MAANVSYSRRIFCKRDAPRRESTDLAIARLKFDLADEVRVSLNDLPMDKIPPVERVRNYNRVRAANAGLDTSHWTTQP